MQNVNILISGPAGKGQLTIEKELVSLLIKNGYYLFSTKNYMSRIRGGHNYHMLRISEKPVNAIAEYEYQIIVAMDELSEKWHKKELTKAGLLIGPALLKLINEKNQIPKETPNAENYLIIGFILAAIGVEKALYKKHPQKKYLESGFELARENKGFKKWPIKPNNKQSNYLFNGNHALVLGALMGGCKYMSGYPMTPATSIMDYFSKRAAEVPNTLHFEQCEDEKEKKKTKK